ncbi:hypothetical protein [Sessilibacter sp. MAH2]
MQYELFKKEKEEKTVEVRAHVRSVNGKPVDVVNYIRRPPSR